ncbi:mannose-1-phosphate guanylyltransferase/mannose-6-phosphate isomerase [Legionella yabuuchiae]|uniref:mannose-1-phosphate guanylyltransferase/mannose-6-phosphate isomerase n=1 Tax=Legionella yabuuchiae TaxID=376727 RepID=UPI001054B6C4|nr:mannose-1-phosphate guanylyltransferase/mannose-6-phosphate isomerase [Legionella yabuuchiae]
MAANIFPVILAGGSGTRLWPLSRKNFPKQFLSLQSDSTLLQQTMKRAVSLPMQEALVVCNEAHYFLSQEQLLPYETSLTYLLEPCPRNTAAAIACAAHFIAQKHGRDAMMVLLPSDHWIGDEIAWKMAILAGVQIAQTHDTIVTFGITPTSPKSGYGYIEAGEDFSFEALKVKRFREKPDEQTAKRFIESGNFYWNSGMFAGRTGVWLEELKSYAPDIYQSTLQSVSKGQSAHDFFRLEVESFSQCRSESIDYAIMENTDKASVIPMNLQWSDLGDWAAVAETNVLDEHGNALQGNVIAKESKNCLISSEQTLVTTLGIQDQIIIATGDAVLVADKRYSQQVKDIVQSLAGEHRQLADDHRRVSRPWGFYEVLAEGPTFKVKRLMVKPGARLSLQMHQHRAEHWVVVGGIADVVNGRNTMQLTANQSTYIPQKTLHRLSNSNQEPLYVIEVQSGDYLGEDDITRYDDVYHRQVETELA